MFEFSLVKDAYKEGSPVIERTAVRAILYQDGKLLLVSSKEGDYKFPGGGIEQGETAQEALKREVWEETGYDDIIAGPCVGTVFEQNDDIEGTGACFQMQSYYYICGFRSDRKREQKLDGYEKELDMQAVFLPVSEALEKNRALLAQKRKQIPEGMLVAIPWLEREIKVLELLEKTPWDRMVWEIFLCGQMIKNAQRSQKMVDEKAGHANFVTTYDKRVQSELKEKLLALVPQAVFVGEEEDIHASVKKGAAFIVDPIDGTTNFIKDYHCSCISVAMTVDGSRQLGIVYNPYLEEMFVARRGSGAYLNGKRIYVSGQPLSNGVVLFGTAPYYEELAKESFALAYEYFKKALDVRRSGSAAIDLCNIACGRAELYFELRLSPWDYAAGSLIVEEAGGRVTTVEGGEITLDAPCSVLAAGTSEKD